MSIRKIQIGTTPVYASQLALGMMRHGNKEPYELQALLEKAIELGINFIDHADIYRGKYPSEEVYGEVMKLAPHLKEKLIVQTKCGICPGYFDSSYEHIIESVDQSLKRMNLEKIDFLLIHRPDALMEPEEMARAFDKLQESGKVSHFGVSNMNPGQMELIQSCVKQPLAVNQVQMSIVHAPMIDAGIHVNMKEERSVMRDGSLLDYAQIHHVTLQAWSIFQASWAEGTFLNHPSYQPLNDELQKLADTYHVTKAAVALAWLLRHPAKIQPIAGATSAKHLEEIAKGFDFTLTRPEWYALYIAAGRQLP